MKENQIPAFVAEVVAAGCDITAVGDEAYILGDSDLPDAEALAAQSVLAEIGARYGDRDHLLKEIAGYLNSIGRGYRPSELGG